MSSAPSSSALITELNSNDVLFGRGAGLREFDGNKIFRMIIQEHRDEYLFTRSQKLKQKIAQDVVDRVHNSGGRFLKLADGHVPPVESTVRDGVWEAVPDSTAIEKCKQALRENRKKACNSRKHGRNDQVSDRAEAEGHSFANVLAQPNYTSDGMVASIPPTGALYPEPSFSLSMPSMVAGGTTTPAIDTRLLLFHMAMQQGMLDSSQPDVNLPVEVDLGRFSQGMHSHACGRQQGMPPTNTSASAGASEGQAQMGDAREMILDASTPAEDTSDLEILSSIASKPVFTEEQEAAERAALTDKERADALSDMFGRCTISSPQVKRARRALEADTIRSLIREMRLEIERTPDKEKRALMEAFSKCRGDEFSDSRLEHFLHCEGMDSKLAARRFVKYWESRRDVFGPEKFVLRMTLSEALRDDLVALETGYCYPLPRKDASGRVLLFFNPSRHTREGYTSDSLLRAMWYMMEVASQENEEPGKGNVIVAWDRHSRLRNYDSKVDDSLFYLDRHCWPHRNIATHSIGASSTLIRICKPFLLAMADKFTRSRVVIHDGPDDQLLDELPNYGIERNMLPRVMGGTLNFDQMDWIANRRAVELEAI